MQWVYDLYKEYNTSEFTIIQNFGGVSSSILKDGDVVLYELAITFKAESDIKGLSRQSDNTYRVELTQILVSKSGIIEVVDCYIKNANVSEYNLGMLYNAIKKDGRFASDLLKFPKNEFPKEIKEINISKILVVEHVKYELVLNELVIALLGSEKTDRTYVDSNNHVYNYYRYIVVLYNYVTGEKKTVMEIGDVASLISKVESNNLLLTLEKDFSKNEYENITISTQGKITHREIVHTSGAKEENYEVYSPSGKYCAFTNDKGLYCRNVETGEEKLLIKDIYSDNEVENIGYRPYKFMDENRLIYTSTGYEWSNGFGVYNVETGADKFIEGTGDSDPIAILGEDIFFVVYDGYDSDAIKVVHLNKNYKIDTVFSSIRENAIDSVSLEVSKDGTLLAVLKPVSYKLGSETYEISIYDLVTYKKLKTYTMSTGLMSVQYIDFLDNGKILLTGEQHALCDKYMFVLDIT